MARRPIPAWLRRILLPIWNGGHRFAWRLGAYLGAVRHRRFGRCEVCGRFGPWLVQGRVVPPRLAALWGLSPTLTEALARKESSNCAWCGAKLRARRIARVVLDRFPVGPDASSVGSLADWVGTPEARRLRIAEINRVEGLHEVLERLPGLAFSDYHDPDAGLPRAGDARSEDLTRLSYPDAAFDLVITSETLEHVPDLAVALAEVHRVLVPDTGLHIFTVPLLPGVSKTHPRIVVRPDGSLERLAAEIRHPGGDTGYLVFTEFGADLGALLDAAGFDWELVFGPVREDDLGQVWVARARGREARSPGST